MTSFGLKKWILAIVFGGFILMGLHRVKTFE
jgi:hypothetical protein